MKRFLILFFVLFSTLLLLSMGVRVQIEVSLDSILNDYNEMNFKNVVSNYFTLKSNGYLSRLPSEFIYIFAVSLYKTSNYSEVLNFSNLNISNPILSNMVILLISFSMSEIGEFEKSDRLILSVLPNSYFTYYSSMIEYYRFRNNIFTKGGGFLSTNSIVSLLKEEDIDRIIAILPFSDDKFSVYVSGIISNLKKYQRKVEEIASILEKKSYSSQKSMVIIARNLINSGFLPNGNRLMLRASLPLPVKDYYTASLMIDNRDFSNASKIINELIGKYEKYRSEFRDYNISLDDLLILGLRVYSTKSSKDFNSTAMEYIKNGGVKFVEYVLRNYKILNGDTYLAFVTNYFSKVDLNYATKYFSSSFISFNFHEGNTNDLMVFCDFMLKRTKNTSWEKEFLLLKFLLVNSYQEKLKIAKSIILNYPFTYEYISILNYLRKDQSLLNELLPSMVSDYEILYNRYFTNNNLYDLNSMIGIKFLCYKFGVNLEMEFDVYEEAKKFKNKILSVGISYVNTNTASVREEVSSSKIKYVEDLFNKGLILDANLEFRSLFPKVDFKYIDYCKKFGMVDLVCRIYERSNFNRDSIYDKMGVVVLAFLDDLYPLPFLDKIEKYSSLYGVNRSLVYGIMRQESRFSPFVVSKADAIGLMQLIVSTADMTARKFWSRKEPISKDDIFVVDNNINLGIAHIKELFDYFSKYPEDFLEILVVSSYNGGMNAVRKWYDSLKTSNVLEFVEGIRFYETKEYTKIVLENKFIYENFVFSNFLAKKNN